MNSIIRLTAAINKVNCGNPQDFLEECKALLADHSVGDSDITVFPRLSLCSPSCGNLFHSPLLLERCAAALGEMQSLCVDREGYVIVGLAIDDMGKPVSVMAVLYKGELIGLVPTLDNDAPLVNEGFSQQLLPADTVFAVGDLRFCILSCGIAGLAARVTELARTGCDLILIPSYFPAVAGQEEEVISLLSGLSRSLGIAIALVNGGVGDTSFPYVYRGFTSILECGTELAYMQAGTVSASCTVDLDLDIIRSQKLYVVAPTVYHSIIPGTDKPGLLRNVDRNPFLPSVGRAEYLTDLYELAVRSLAARLENIGISKVVLGISGGLDSTAALLICVGAMDLLELPRTNIIAITMPGFGTSDQTYFNALQLMEALGVTKRDISIRRAVTDHLEDIEHRAAKDVVYENAQARERSQILLDVANAVSGIVVGSGDLSEEALGFSTFGGDHLANYNVNVCFSKTVLRELVWHIASTGIIPGIEDTVRNVLETPVSPELLPPENGEITQKTEEILGPYELHDFFTYYFLRYRMRPSKILFYASIAFSDRFSPDYIREKLRLFFSRFCSAQFKRSCAPDAASIAPVNLLGVNFQIPSDLDPSLFLQDLEESEA